MSILVTGGTGSIGSQVLAHLDPKTAEIRALTRNPESARLPAGVKAVKGDLSDVDSMRHALSGVSTLFLLVANAADELTQALLTLNLAREAGVKGIVYLSVFEAERHVNVPHFIGKRTAEQMIEKFDLPATILRAAYFTQNDAQQKDALLSHGVYASPIGHKGISMVDTRDIGEAAAKELMRRETARGPLPRETYALVGPDVITAKSAAAVWSTVLAKEIRYAGDDLAPLEGRLKTFAPSWLSYDLSLMFRGYQQLGARASDADIDRLKGLLGRAPRSYRDFAKETAAIWAKA